MAVAFFVSAHRHLGNVGVHGAVGEGEHNAGTAGAAGRPVLQFEFAKVGDEIGFPHMAAGPLGEEVALAGKIAFLALAFGETVGVFKDECVIVEEVDDHRQIVGGDQTSAVLAAAVEMLVFGVERQGEKALGPPFKTVGTAVIGLDGGRAMTFQDIDHLFEEMALGRRFGARVKLDDIHGNEIAAALQVDERALGCKAGPGPGLDLEQIDAEILNDRNAFLLCPVQIGVEQKSRFRGFGHRIASFHFKASCAVHAPA